MSCEADRSRPYNKGPYNKFNDTEQWIRLSEGCPNKCPYCRESFENPEFKVFPIPEIVRNDVKIIDMNLICQKEALPIIKTLGDVRVNGKVVYYELVCGVDYRFMTMDIALALRDSRFKNIRIAWDSSFGQQCKIKSAIGLLLKAGYKPGDIMIFCICNWRISFAENMRKMDLCKIWNVKMADCYFDNQLSPNIKPIFWTKDEIKTYRHNVRKHNQMVNFRIDPQYGEAAEQSPLI
jgi:hypothetical protein